MAARSFSDLETKLDGFFHLAPPLPADIKDLIVNYGPYLALVGGILGILSSGILNFFIVGWAPKMYEFSLYNYYLQVVFNLIAAVILLLAFKPLQNKKLRGWRMLFYLTLLEVILLIFTINVAGLIFCFLSLYLLFQVKDKYSEKRLG